MGFGGLRGALRRAGACRHLLSVGWVQEPAATCSQCSGSLTAPSPHPYTLLQQIGNGFTGLLHESEMRRAEGTTPLSEGDEVQVVVLSVRGDKVALTQRSAAEVQEVRAAGFTCGGG